MDEKHKKKIASLVKSSMRNPDTDFYDRVARQYGEERKKEREEKLAKEKNKRFKKLERHLASKDNK
jgi:hypothetical protein